MLYFTQFRSTVLPRRAAILGFLLAFCSLLLAWGPRGAAGQQLGGSLNIPIDGHAWSVDAGNHVSVWDLSTGSLITSFSQSFGNGRGAAYDPTDGNIWVSTSAGPIYKIPPLGGAAITSIPDPGGAGISALCYDAEEHVLWASSYVGSNVVYKLNPTTGAVLSTISIGGRDNDSLAVAHPADLNGEKVILVTGHDGYYGYPLPINLYAFDVTTKTLVKTYLIPRAITGIAIDPKTGDLIGRSTSSSSLFNFGPAPYSTVIGELKNFDTTGLGEGICFGPCPPLSQYDVTDLGVLAGGANSAAYGINTSGSVVGQSQTSTGAWHAFQWIPGAANGLTGSMQDLGTLTGGVESNAFSINAVGQIVGASYDAFNNSHAFFYNGSVMTDLGTLGGMNSVAYGINDGGMITGEAENLSQNFHAFSGTTSTTTLTDKGTLPAGSYSEAFAINSANAVVGEADIFGLTDAVTGGAGALTDLGTPLNGTYGSATALNVSGNIVGQADTILGDIHAFVYNSGVSPTDLGTLPSTLLSYSAAFGINKDRTIVGTSYTDSGYHAFVVACSDMTDLNTLIPSTSGWVLQQARGVNNKGQIVGYGLINGQQHGFLLTPKNP